MTEHVSAKLRLELAGNKGIVNPVCSPATVGDAGQVAPPAAEQVRLEHANPVAEGSVSTAPSAALGPLLVTTMVYTVAEQVRDVDASLLEPLTSCQCRTLLSARLQAARDLGLQLQSDRALYVVLSLQLPTGFEREAPFAEALDRCRRGFQTFGDALDHVSSEQWRVWDEKLDPV